MATYQLSIITPDGKVFEDQVESLSAPGLIGGFGVLRNHAPMVASLKEGVLKLKANNQDHYYAIGSGILEVNQEKSVLVLCNQAQKEDTAQVALETSKIFENN